MGIERADFAIITIREDEYAAVAKRFCPTPQRGISGRSYGVSVVKTKDGKRYTIAIARCAEAGPLPAQQLTHDIIRDLSPSLVLVVGIAGAVPDTNFTLGDVIVSSRIYDFDVNAFKAGEIQWNTRGGIDSKVSEITASLPIYEEKLKGWNTPKSIGVARPDMAHEIRQIVFDGETPIRWQQVIIKSLKKNFDTSPIRSEPLYNIGSIASSGSLIRDTSVLIQWLKNERSIRAIEMEAGGVFEAAQQLRQQYPVIVIRGISDIVGLQRDDRWTLYACHSAAAFTYALLTSTSSIFTNICYQNDSTLNLPLSESNSTKEEYHQKAKEYVKNKMYEEALDAYEHAIRFADDQDASLYQEKGDLLAERGLFEEALTSYEKARRLDNLTRADFYYVKMGEVFLRQGRYKEAQTSFNGAVKFDKAYDSVYYMKIGDAFFREAENEKVPASKEEKYDKARIFYDKAIEKSPDNAQIHGSRARALFGLAQIKEDSSLYKSSLASYRDALRHSEAQTSSRSPLYRSSLYKESGDILAWLFKFDEAIASYNEATRLAPDFGLAYWAKGRALEQKAEITRKDILQQAQDAYRQANDLGISKENGRRKK